MYQSALLIAYLAACFLLSALTVRASPRGRVGVALRRRLWLFPFLPLLWALAAGRTLARAAVRGLEATKRVFERLSGHRTYRRLGHAEYYHRKDDELRKAAK